MSESAQICCTDSGGVDPGYVGEKERYLKRLRRIEGQVRGIARMVDEGQYCIDILTQISALDSALENVALGLLEDHLRHCVADAARTGGDVADTKLTEATAAIRRLVKS
ncbi:metal-sensitive transcriptional regulator [Dermatophilus congolensis]|uniref:metal-sensitive transcriptional regulator n=1 Tax=Dermatophilus congolensis TaxID=1863 RepID=UPI000E0EDF9C